MVSTEWESLTLEAFELRQNLIATRAELARALHRHDAACRVIARLLKEKEQGAQQQQSASSSSSSSSSGSAADDEEELEHEDTPLVKDEALSTSIKDLATKLVSERQEANSRRPKPAPQSIRQYSNIKTFKTSVQPSSLALFNHSTSCAAIGSPSGEIECLSLDFKGTPASTKSSHNRQSRSSLANRWSAHQNTITDLKFLSSRNRSSETVEVVDDNDNDNDTAASSGTTVHRLLSSSLDSTVRLWELSSPNYRQQLTTVYKTHSDAVRSIDVHPGETCFLSASEDGTWSLTNVETADVLCRVSSAAPKDTTGVVDRLLSARFHPDGTLLAAGSQRSLGIWDSRANRRPLSTLEHPLANQDYVAVAFSESGYHLASGQGNGRLVLWDLRTCSIIHSAMHSAAVSSLAFEPAARYLSVGFGSNVAVYRVADKTCRELVSLQDNLEQIVGLDFFSNPAITKHADPFSLTAAADSTLRVFGNATLL